ncbi:endocuticle structural glycoprotein SgAbd-9-like [Drosophila serrata]|uniref:endocuticle structural glycoprotein SgAbd-9-like n=1 Tax=Drosophila serrata TaxID=7274 RepID=UPI000A1D025A|nr:endocuticle structural glycoprotein SgAbd-9-like [Drosophila serrata]
MLGNKVEKLLFSAMLAIMASSCSAGFLDFIFPTIMTEYYQQVPTKEGYRFNLEEPNGSKREEIGIIMNPGTDKEELVVMGTYSSYDDKTDTETITMYTADKNGYKPRYKIRNRKLNAQTLKTLTL